MRLLSKKQKQQYQLLSNFALDDNDDDYYDDTPDIYDSYRRPEVHKCSIACDEDCLNQNIRDRLTLARLKALEKYNEVWG